MTSEQQHVDFAEQVSTDPLATWQPVVGPETNGVVDKALPDDTTRADVLTQTRSVLARCGNPSSSISSARTGLVVGYVQSGKTLSFTALTAMARDNGYPLVILLAGTKISLHEQTADRLIDDLRVERVGGMSPWFLVSNPDPTSARASQIATYVKGMTDPGTPEMFKRATVITVMKNTNRLSKLGELLAMLAGQGIDTSTLPVLVVDDEADQAGMNAGKNSDGVKDETPTYSSILSLRSAVPNASYVMYTATPQAPLLISLADTLSPDYVNVLTPGPGYTGGKYFFDQRRSSFVELMSESEVDDALDPSLLEPPRSLEAAIATFFLVKAVVGQAQMVSMLVHPSYRVDLQTLYFQFVQSLISNWSGVLTDGGPDRDELVNEYFAPAYADIIENTEREVPDLETLMETIRFWMGATQVRVVNADPGNDTDADLNWATAPAWIVIGGNKLDRGFTIEGLAVTYMPRGVGVGNADTIQQRARFFGYKEAYGDLCRAWLAPAIADAYEHYVEHEEHLRSELKDAEKQGINLKDWTRKMLLDPMFKATRRAVIEIPFLHGRFASDRWSAIDRLGRLGTLADANWDTFEKFRADHGSNAVVDERDQRTDRRHEIFAVPLQALVEELLIDWQGNADDRVMVQQLSLLLLARIDDHPELMADVYLMDGFGPRARSLSKTDHESVSALQQGRAPQGPYQGDAAFYTEGRFTLQVHNVVSKNDTGPAWSGIGLTFRLPKDLAGGALIQYGVEP